MQFVKEIIRLLGCLLYTSTPGLNQPAVCWWRHIPTKAADAGSNFQAAPAQRSAGVSNAAHSFR